VLFSASPPCPTITVPLGFTRHELLLRILRATV
jgi:hypothetical protein